MKDLRRLLVWQKAHDLTMSVYKITKGFPKEERYGLTSQLRRAATSIPTNIAEGCGRRTSSDFGRFLQVAMGSTSEAEYLLLLSHELELIKNNEYDVLALKTIEIKKMLFSLIRVINKKGSTDG